MSLCPNTAEGDEPALLILSCWESVGCSLLLHVWVVGEPCLHPRWLHAAGTRARLGALPVLAARVCAWLCVDSAQLLQPTVVMDLPSGLVCASSSWPLVAHTLPVLVVHTAAWLKVPMPCHASARLSCV